LLDTQQRVWAIDHGVCFAADFKLRTVIWEFGGEELPQELRDVIEPLVESVPLNVSALLSSDEIFALQERAQWICEGGAFPIDKTGSRYPWPLVGANHNTTSSIELTSTAWFGSLTTIAKHEVGTTCLACAMPARQQSPMVAKYGPHQHLPNTGLHCWRLQKLPYK
jgi:hypothetical protein